MIYPKHKVCFVVSAEITVKSFLVEHIRTMAPHFDIHVVVNTGDTGFIRPYGIDVPVIPVAIERKISPITDGKALIRLYRLFREGEYDIIHSVTPKAGLLSMVAGLMARVPIRVHTFTGQVWAIRRGFNRGLLKSMDKIIALCATHVLVDSPSQRDFIVSEGVISAAKAEVIADGSICGVDAVRFVPSESAREAIRKDLSIAGADIVFLYLGRMNKDKGLLVLAESFSRLSGRFPEAHLVMAGPDEEGVKDNMLALCKGCSEKVHFIGYAERPEQLMAAADVFCLPSFREGFGLVVIEAASAGIPSIASRIYGITDTIEDGKTGLLFSPGNAEELARKMEYCLNNTARINEMGEAARERSLRLYSTKRVTEAMLDYYRGIAGIS